MRRFFLLSYINIALVVLIGFMGSLALVMLAIALDSSYLFRLPDKALAPTFVISAILSASLLVYYFIQWKKGLLVKTKKTFWLAILNTSLVINYALLIFVVKSCDYTEAPFGLTIHSDPGSVCRGWPFPLTGNFQLGHYFLINIVFWAVIVSVVYYMFRLYLKKFR